MKSHVVSLELSKKLYRLGVELETEYWWNCIGATPHLQTKHRHPVKQALTVNPHWLERDHLFPAPLASELGEVLPKLTWSGRTLNGKKEDSYVCFLDDHSQYEKGLTMPNALAKMLIYLKEK